MAGGLQPFDMSGAVPEEAKPATTSKLKPFDMMGAVPEKITENVDLGSGGYLGRDPRHPFGLDPGSAQPSQLSSMDDLPTKHQLNISYLAKQNNPGKLRDYLTSNGYRIVGWDADGHITFADKANKQYKANSFAAIPAGVNALPVAGQIAGTLGGGFATGGLGGEVAGAAAGDVAGEYAQKKILEAAGVPTVSTPKSIAENAAVAGVTQGALGAAVPAVARNLSGLKMGEEAMAAREAEIGAAGDTAAAKQGERLLAQTNKVEDLSKDLTAQEEAATAAETAKVEKAATQAATKQATKIEATGNQAEKAARTNQQRLAAQVKKTQENLDKFRTTIHEQATEALGKEQEARELEQLTGRTPAEVQARKSQLIAQGAQTTKEAREPYYDAFDKIKTQQGELFDQVFQDVPKTTPVQAQVGPDIQGVKDFANQNQLKFSSEVNGLLNKTQGVASEVDPAELEGQVTQVISGRHPDPTVNARFNGLRDDFLRAHDYRMNSDQLSSVARQALGVSDSPANLGDLLGLRSRWLAVGRARSASAADRWAANRMVNALDTQIEATPGLSDEVKAQLTQARDQYHEFKNVFDNKLQDAVFKATDPTEVAKAIVEGHEKAPLNLIDAIKDDPLRMSSLRDSYHDYVMDAGGPDKSRAILARDEKNGVLKAMFGDGAYNKYQTWLRTPNYQRFAERALSTETYRKAFQKSIHDAFGTPESRAMVDKFREAQELFSQAPSPADARATAVANLPSPEAAAQQVRTEGMAQVPQAVAAKTAQPAVELAAQQTRLANMPSPEAAARVEIAAQTATQNPNQAAGNAFYEQAQHKNLGMFGGSGWRGFLKRHAMFAAMSGYMRNPAIWLATGGVMGYDALWSWAVRSPESAQAYWNFIHKVASSKGFQTAGKAFISLNSALLDNLIREDRDARARQQQQGQAQ